jgi:hypothetical protein
VHAANASRPVDSEHWKVAGFDAENANVAFGLFVIAAGDPVIVTTGAPVSIVNARVAAALAFPAASVAITLKV